MSTAEPVRDPGLRAFLVLAWPIVVARASQSVIGFTDAAMVAPLGNAEFTAATAGSLNAFNVLILPMGTIFIVQSFASQLFGRGDLAGARRYAIYGLLFALAVQVVALALLPLVPWALSHVDYEPAVRDLMADYLVYRLAGTGFVVATEALGNYRAGLGDTRSPMAANATAMFANIGLNWVFIYGHLGAPAMGVKGAALASTISSAVGMLVLVIPFVREGGRIGAAGTLRVAEGIRMLRFGISNGFNWFFEFAAFSVFVNVIVAKLGTASVGAIMAVFNVNSLAFMPALGLASAGAVLVGHAIGAGHPDAVGRLVRRTAFVAMGWQIFVGLVYAAFPLFVMSAFGANAAVATDPVVTLGARLLPLSALWQLFDAIGIVVGESLRAAGDTAWCLGARLVLAWAVFVPSAWYLVAVRGGGEEAAILSVVGYLAVLSAALFFRFRSGAWRRIDLTGAGAPIV